MIIYDNHKSICFFMYIISLFNYFAHYIMNDDIEKCGITKSINIE